MPSTPSDALDRRTRPSASAANGTVPEAVSAEDKASIEVLVVDDERTLRESCASLLRSEGFPVTVMGRGDEAKKLLERRSFDIVLADLYMAEFSGMELMKAAFARSPDTIVILMTGNPSVETSLEGLRAGAWDYIPKPFSAMQFHILMGRAAHTVLIGRESSAARRKPKRSGDDGPTVKGVELLGASASFKRILNLAQRVAATDASVFLTGESGSGKELIAHYIHDRSRRSSRELVPLNCAAIPENLLESEMFGHVEGAFTGAVREKKGLLEVAHGGTLFLDELTEMPTALQAKLLRVIQDGVVRRVGSSKTDAVVNVRFIAATNVDPTQAVREGSLRSDLHYRLRVVPIHVPPLRERRSDIPVLAANFLAEFWGTHRGVDEEAPELSSGALEAMTSWPWRGNVRELRNVMEHLAVLATPGASIAAEDLPLIDDDGGAALGGGVIPVATSVLDSDYHTARERVIADFEFLYLEHIVRSAGGNISDAARMAGVDRTTLYRLMEKHGTSRDELLPRGS